jgi:hypothetical protein
MNESAEIIPINPTDQDAAISKLLQAKAFYTAERLSGMLPDEVKGIEEFYRVEALAARLLTRINVAIRVLGERQTDGWRWDYNGIRAEYKDNGVTDVVSKENRACLVTQNTFEFVPGEWLVTMDRMLKRKTNQQQLASLLAAQQEHERRINALSADV